MISLIPDGFNDFHCKGGACRHTCCQVWIIDIDEDTAAYYQHLEGPLGEKLRASMEKSREGWHFRLNDRGFCPLLEPDGLCQVVKELGDDALCDICAVHPRFFTHVDDEIEEYTLCGTGLCCEETCEILGRLKGPIRFRNEDTGERCTLPELLEDMGWGPIPKTLVHFRPILTEAEAKKILQQLAETEPIDPAWTREMEQLPEKLPLLMTRQQAYTAACDPDLFDRFYHFILYRQLDKLDAYGLETLIQYARQSTQYIFLKAALTGDPLEAARRWSEQIEYDTENVGKLLEGIEPSQPQMDDKK